MHGTIPPTRPGGTTEADLRDCARFVFCRPGWSVEEGATERGEACIRLRVRHRGRGAAIRVWRVCRAEGRLAVVGEADQESRGDLATMREALVLIWEAEESRSAAA